jgi:hypothetical protein
VFHELKARADRVAGDAARLRQVRNEHARHGYRILKQRAGSPLGLTLSFGAGVFAGARSRRPDGPGGEDREMRRAPEPREEGLMHRLLHGPFGAVAIRLGTAFIAGSLMQPDQPEPPTAL